MSKEKRLESAVAQLAAVYSYCARYGIDLEHVEDAAYIIFQEDMEQGDVERLAA